MKQIQLTIVYENDNGVKKSHTHSLHQYLSMTASRELTLQHVTGIISLVPLSNTYFLGDKTKAQ